MVAEEEVGLEGDGAASTVRRTFHGGASEPRGTSLGEADEKARDQDLFHRARAEDVLHWQQHRRPISAEPLGKRLHVGSRRARALVTQLRADPRGTLDIRANQSAMAPTAGDRDTP
jgi:hypothetical protein